MVLWCIMVLWCMTTPAHRCNPPFPQKNMEAGHSHTSFAMFCYVLLTEADEIQWCNCLILPHMPISWCHLARIGALACPFQLQGSTELQQHFDIIKVPLKFCAPLNWCSIYFNLTLNLLGNTFEMPVRQAISCNFNGSNLESMTQFDQSNEGIYTELHRYLFQPVNVGLLNPK